MIEWFVASTQLGSEYKALLNLQRQNIECYFPRYIKQRRHARKIDTVAAPLFPGYMFIRMDRSTTAWRKINSTFGIRSLICAGERPLPVPENIVDEIRQNEDENGMITLGKMRRLCKGDKVKLISGAFLDQIGIFDGMTDAQRVFVLLDILGRQVRISAPLPAISACA
jgi:transcriptional antiterminator RfaH